jgi:hypothetical protein
MKLEIGQKIFYVRDNILSKFKIVRVTQTIAIDNRGTKFGIEYSESWCLNEKKKQRWSRGLYYISSPELEEQYRIQTLKLNYTNIIETDINIISEADMQAIIEILSKYNK